MVIRGNSRGNAKQLASYLLDKRDNEDIRILDVDGQFDADSAALHRAVFAMGISAELSKGDKGLYHAQINPDIEASGNMTDDHWLQASDILAKQLGLENQRRVIVLHSKKLRTHAHCVWERFDHQKGKLVSDSFSRLAQDRARKEMEEVLEHKPTPHRNKHRPELKASLTKIWEETETGQDFIKQARKQKYIIGAGSGRAPFIVADEFGRSYDLTRQLQGVKLKEVRARLRNEPLIGEKDAIVLARSLSDSAGGTDGKGKEKQTHTPKPANMNQQEKSYAEKLQGQFASNRSDTTKTKQQIESQRGQQKTPVANKDQEAFANNKEDVSRQQEKQQETRQPVNENNKQQAQAKQITDKEKEARQQSQDKAREEFHNNKRDATKSEEDKNVKKQFKENKPTQENTSKKDEAEKERERQRVRAKLQKMQEEIDRQRGKNKGLDMG